MLILHSRQLVSFALALGCGIGGSMSPLMVAMPVEARSLSQVALQLKRQGAAVQVVVVGLGANARVVTQTSSGSIWRGRLIGDVDAALREGPQQVSMPGFGLDSIRLDASDGGFELQIEATPGRSLPKRRSVLTERISS